MIEAKRLYLWTDKLDGNPPSIKKNIKSVQEDIKALRKLGNVAARRNAILVWSVVTRRSPMTPKAFLTELKDPKVKPYQTRAIPIGSINQTDKAWPPAAKQVRWAWVMLAEVT